MDNIISLHRDLESKEYTHGGYTAFNISDPKPRNIHKASVRDRLLHHAVYRVLYPYFDKRFIHDSYSCRIGKGTHRAMNQFRNYASKVSKNNTKQCWILKCDIRKFFASIDHQILKSILSKHLDPDTIWLLSQIIDSFHTNPHLSYSLDAHISHGLNARLSHSSFSKKGLPLGNLTSQLLVNIYMNEFDQYIKHKLLSTRVEALESKVKHYIRYADDFVILSQNKTHLTHIRDSVNVYLEENLKLSLHPNKVHIKTLSSGIDFLGWVHFPHHRVLRTTTKRRMLKSLANNPSRETRASYLGLLKHGDTWKLRIEI